MRTVGAPAKAPFAEEREGEGGDGRTFMGWLGIYRRESGGGGGGEEGRGGGNGGFGRERGLVVHELAVERSPEKRGRVKEE